MGSILLDNGESVYLHDGTGSADPVAIAAAQASNIAALMAKRERFDFTWADASERTSQTGMVQGSRGYQEDIKSEYLYDNSVWRLSLPYIEFTANQSPTPDSSFVGTGSYSVDATNSTDTTMVTCPSSGVLRFANPGIYSIESMTVLRDSGDTAYRPATARSFIDISTPATIGVPIHRQSVGSGEDQLALAMPSLRITASATDIQHYAFKVNGDGNTLMKTRIRIARLG